MARTRIPLTEISSINLGAPAAERDIEKGLEEYFFESATYDRVRRGSKRIIIGARDGEECHLPGFSTTGASHG